MVGDIIIKSWYTSSEDLQVDNSSLSGESDPQKRTWKKSDDMPLEGHCVTFFGTLVYNGSGRGLVIAIGDDTFMDQTASGNGHGDTSIAKRIKDFVFNVSGVPFALSISFLIINFIKTEDFFGIIYIVANVPEGSLATVTLSLTLTAKNNGRDDNNKKRAIIQMKGTRT